MLLKVNTFYRYSDGIFFLCFKNIEESFFTCGYSTSSEYRYWLNNKEYEEPEIKEIL